MFIYINQMNKQTIRSEQEGLNWLKLLLKSKMCETEIQNSNLYNYLLRWNPKPRKAITAKPWNTNCTLINLTSILQLSKTHTVCTGTQTDTTTVHFYFSSVWKFPFHPWIITTIGLITMTMAGPPHLGGRDYKQGKSIHLE